MAQHRSTSSLFCTLPRLCTLLCGVMLVVPTLGCSMTETETCASAGQGGASSKSTDAGAPPCTNTCECAAGLECRPEDNVTEKGCETAPVSHCAAPGWSDNAATRQLLIRGFGASPLQLTRQINEHETIPRFEWERPVGASILVCGLFSCPPRFAPDDAGVPAIENADECLMRMATFVRPPKIIDVRDVKDRALDVKGKPIPPAKHRKPAALRFGCWLYGSVAVLGATALERLRADEIPDLRQEVKDCKDVDDAVSCTIAGLPFLGHCLDHACVASCTTPSDCLALADILEGDAGIEKVDADVRPDARRCMSAESGR